MKGIDYASLHPNLYLGSTITIKQYNKHVSCLYKSKHRPIPQSIHAECMIPNHITIYTLSGFSLYMFYLLLLINCNTH